MIPIVVTTVLEVKSMIEACRNSVATPKQIKNKIKLQSVAFEWMLKPSPPFPKIRYKE